MANKLFRRLVAGLAVLAVSIAAIPARAQDVIADPETYDFFTVYIGQSETMTGTITNADGGTVFITSWEWTYNPLGAFQVTSGWSLPYPLPADASTDYQVTFTPPDFSFWNATLRIHTSSAKTPEVDVEFWGFGEFHPDPCYPLTDCGGVCVDMTTDTLHCGSCDNVCLAPPEFGSATCEASVCGIVCDSGYVLELGFCVPVIEDPVTLMNDLLVFYDTSITNGSLESAFYCGRDDDCVGPGYVSMMRSMLSRALVHLEDGRMSPACSQLYYATRRIDGWRSPPDFVRGPATGELNDRIRHIKTVMGCDS